MGSLDTLAGKRVYFDTNIVIYILERPDQFERQAAALVDAVARDAFHAVTGELTISEVVSGIAKLGDKDALHRCLDFFESGDVLTLHPVTRDAFYRAGLLRGTLGVSTPDAIHMATALDAECGVFLTNDRRLRAPSELQIFHFGNLP
jgi:predicted nucleic acid-binding protein